jgi:WD40 repeat protein
MDRAPRAIADEMFGTSPVGETMGRYRIVCLLGQGGMGRVYEADDLELGRRVAIKFLPASASEHAERVGRFISERSVTAGLEHPGIIPIYDSGVWSNGQPFYVMRKVAGAPLDRLISQASTLEERLRLLGTVLAVADAVAFAHSHGVIHRDLKPANILVASFGETLVADWGLAKRSRKAEVQEVGAEDPSGAPGETRAGSVLGTPAYMSPEQSQGAAVDERADVYAIGVMLHELLAGRRPDEANGDKPTRLPTVSRGQALPSERLPPGLEDLAAIVSKAVAPSLADRYANAGELADELRRFQTGQLVGARRYTRPDLVKRWMRRNRGMVLLGSGLGTILAVVAVTSVLRIVHERDAAKGARTEAERARTEAEGARKETAARNDGLVLLQARALLEQDPTASLAWLKTYPESGPDWKAVSEIASDAWSRGVARYVWHGDQPFVAIALAFSPDGSLLAAGNKEKGLHVWELSTGQFHWLASDVELGGPVMFSPDGQWVASTNGSKLVRLWDVATGSRRDIGPMNATRLRFTQDNKLLVGTGRIEGAHVWDAATGEIRELLVDGRKPNATSVIKGTHSVVMQVGDAFFIESLDTGRYSQLGRLPYPPLGGSMGVSPDGQWIAFGSGDSILLFDRQANRLRTLPSRNTLGSNVIFLPDGTLLSFGAAPGMLRWDKQRGEAHFMETPDGFASAVGSLEGGFLRGGGASHVGYYSSLDEPARPLLGHTGLVAAVALSPDGKWAASSSADQSVRVWRLGEGDLQTFHQAGPPAKLSTDGRMLLVSRPGDLAAKVIDVATGNAELLTGPRSWVWGGTGAISSDGREVVLSDLEQRLTLVDLSSKARRTLVHYGPAGTSDGAEAFSPDGRLVAVGEDDRSVQLVTVDTGERRLLGKCDAEVGNVVFSPDGRWLATTGWERTLRIWDTSGATVPRVLVGHSAEISDVKFSRDGQRLVTASGDGIVRVWNLDGGDALVLRGHTGAVSAAAFSPDGSVVVSVGNDKTVRIWDLVTGENRIIRRGTDPLTTISFSADGKSILYGGLERTIRVSDPFATPGLDKDPMRLRAWLEQETTAEVDPQGTLASKVPH